MTGAPAATASGARRKLAGFLACVCDGARLMVGVPNYDAYVAHMAALHPDKVPMTYAEFFRNRQAARYGADRQGGFRCC